MLFLFRSAPEVEKRIHSKLFCKFWRNRGTKEPAYITVYQACICVTNWEELEKDYEGHDDDDGGDNDGDDDKTTLMMILPGSFPYVRPRLTVRDGRHGSLDGLISFHSVSTYFHHHSHLHYHHFHQGSPLRWLRGWVVATKPRFPLSHRSHLSPPLCLMGTSAPLLAVMIPQENT